jgi:hypothetical protein
MRTLHTTLGLPLAALLLYPAIRQAITSNEAAAAPAAAEREKPAASSARLALADRALQPFQVELLELAFGAASALPLEPHVKNRARLQEQVAAACIELEQPSRALQCMEAIPNWRRGAGYADLGLYCAQRGDAAFARDLLARARDLADHLEGEEVQDWHRDRILAKAADLEAALASQQTPRSAVATPLSIESELSSLEPALSSADFEVLRQSLSACVELYDRAYADAEWRGRIEARMRKGWERMPALVRLELALALAEAALDHADSERGMALLDEAAPWLEDARAMPEYQVPLQARWAGLRQRAGDRDGAARASESAWSTYVAERERIVDIDRADALLPLAATFHALGDAERAQTLFALAVEEAVHNPNSRPRAEDLTAACLALATRGIEPAPGLRERLLEVREALGDPW